ncbi:nuclear transport factor 2 family protein [Frankia sp. CiP3]|uniref:nuclear transport factor 2 family protein n=1 Tax=Frankia sp. CiP3 TaxID=2880971 RepID=UPI001EF5CB63|nr:nuclear transport factor 2 family protein [Frankia sp. CiP3]
MSSDIDVVTLFFRASENSEIETALGCFAPGGVWIDPTGKVHAEDTVESYLKEQIELLRSFESQGVSVNYTPMVQEGDRVYVGATVNQPDGTEIRRFVDVFTMQEGKILTKDVFAKE